MNNHLFPSLVLRSMLAILCVLISIPSSYSDDDEQYAACNSRPYNCGQQIQNISYPFWGKDIRPQYCGRQGFELKCQDNQNTTIQFGDQSFRVLDINMLHQTMIIARDDIFSSLCSAGIFQETKINYPLFNYSANVRNLSLYYDCSGELLLGQNNFSCPSHSEPGEIAAFYTIDGYPSFKNLSDSCNSVVKFPFFQTPAHTVDIVSGGLIEVLKRGFEVEYHIDQDPCMGCMSSFGTCGSNRSNLEQFVCLCRDEPHMNNCSNNPGTHNPDNWLSIDNDLRLQNRTNTSNRVIKVPVLLSDPLNSGDLLAGRLTEALKRGFEVEYRIDNASCSACLSSFGICGSNQSSDKFACLCRDKPHTSTCPSATGNSPNMREKVGAGSAAAGIIGIVTTASILFCLVRSRTKISSIPSLSSFENMTKNDQDLEAFIRDCGPLPLKRFSFLDVMVITNSFKDKLGQGGYGGVYKGKLSDGCLVAVKLLNTSKGNGQEFINEVASISRTSHVNIVTLLGFCLEGNERALIYEFMSNGSLEKFIYNGDTSNPTWRLGWEKMIEIFTGIARGLEYLHRGCNTRILHFDIKPHNILLDEDFCPKIADFGLAKLCSKKESIVSMLETRGTIGYIAPEVFSRNFGNVSHKSDVYSYGMMVLEMAGCRKNLVAGGSNSSELYFPHWIYKHMEQGKEFEWPGVVTSEENEIAKKMIIVGLWCIQSRPWDRPSINTVLEMLRGSIEGLETPPMPFLSSPSRPPSIHSSTTSKS